MTEPRITITVHYGTVHPEVLDQAVALYREIYAEPPYFEGEDDFASFADSLPKRARQSSFRLVVARVDDEPVGFAMGHQLPLTTDWWEGAVTSISSAITTESPDRTFAVIELAVAQKARRQGIGGSLHTHLTAGLREERATLLVRPEASAAQAAYTSWGYERIAKIRPSSEAPTYDSMICNLKASSLRSSARDP